MYKQLTESYSEYLERNEREKRLELGYKEPNRNYYQYTTSNWSEIKVNEFGTENIKVAGGLIQVIKKFWYFQTVTQCPVCEKKKITRERREGEKPEDPDQRKKLILRYCKCSYK